MWVHAHTQVHTVLAGLMDRLARYAATDAASLSRLTAMDAFDRFKDAISHILMAQVSVRVRQAWLVINTFQKPQPAQAWSRVYSCAIPYMAPHGSGA